MELIENSAFATRDQELLLHAALLEGAAAAEAWKEWKRVVDLEGHLDSETFALLPLLYTNLQKQSAEFPHMNILKGIYRHAWYRNQRFFSDAGRTVSSLHDEGVPTMILKGLPLTILYYKNFGVCPMSDIDILVPPLRVQETADLLKKTGWSATDASRQQHMQHHHFLRFSNGSGVRLKLYWYLIARSSSVDSDCDFWEKAVQVIMHGVPTLALNPTDMLFHVIADGRGRTPGPSVHWIADAMTIIHSSPHEIDWMRIIAQAKKHRILLQIKESLRYLCENFAAKVPKTIMDNVKNIRVSPLEHIEYRRVVRRDEDGRETLLGGLPLYLIEYLRLTRDTGLLQRFAGFPRYLQYRLHERSFLHLVISLTGRIVGTIKRKLSWSVRRKKVKSDGTLNGRGNVFR